MGNDDRTKIEIEEGEEDALDAALEMELAATYAKDPVPQTSEPANHVGEERTVINHEPTSSQLSFVFPGWEIDIAKGEKRKMPSISRHIQDSQFAPRKRLKQGKATDTAGPSRGGSLPSNDPSIPVESCPVDLIDDEVLACIFMKLNVRGLCASMRTCKRWHRVACKEDVWGHIPLPTNAPGALPRWMELRNAGISMDLRFRFHGFRLAYEFIRSALNAWWDNNEPDGFSPSAIFSQPFRSLPQFFRSLTKKLVGNDWCLLYEAFGAAFSDRADRIAGIVLAAVERIELSKYSKNREVVTDAKEEAGSGVVGMVSNLPSKMGWDSNAKGSREESFWDEEEVQEIWLLVLSLWIRYKNWLLLVVSHCPKLNDEVGAERARSNALATTPTVYGKGIICFRSQVILKYGIRSLLQATLSGLASAMRSGSASHIQLELFHQADHLFQETSLPDDLTLSPTTFTQQKLRRCFGNETSSKTKPRMKSKPFSL